jgi:hypothetical protein
MLVGFPDSSAIFYPPAAIVSELWRERFVLIDEQYRQRTSQCRDFSKLETGGAQCPIRMTNVRAAREKPTKIVAVSSSTSRSRSAKPSMKALALHSAERHDASIMR